MNSILFGLPEVHLNKLRRIQNAAARLVTGTRKFDHISPILERLHWLPIQYRIQFKILLFVHKSLNGKGPEYISSACKAQSLSFAHQLTKCLQFQGQGQLPAGDQVCCTKTVEFLAFKHQIIQFCQYFQESAEDASFQSCLF